jgi:hypothetical protein
MRTTPCGCVLATAAAALLLAACASSDDVGEIFPGPNGNTVAEVHGVVRAVDTRNDCVIELQEATTNDYRLRDDGYGATGNGHSTVFCDHDTRVVYRGATYGPQDLQRGDEIVADVAQVDGRLVADRIDVTREARAGATDHGGDHGLAGGRVDDRGVLERGGERERAEEPGAGAGDLDRSAHGHGVDPYGGDHDLRGTVRSIDPQGRVLTLTNVDYFSRAIERSTARTDLVALSYDVQTRVSFRGQSYRPENLEPGDVVVVRVDDVRGTLVAGEVDVVNDVRGNAAQYPQ